MDTIEVRRRIEYRIQSSRRIDYGTYQYFVWPYKGIAPLVPDELDFMVGLLKDRAPADADLLFTFQTDGEVLAIPLSLRLRKPLMIARDFRYEIPDPLVITQHTRYWTRNLYCERIPAERKVVIVEALISTGNTVIEAVRQIRAVGAEVTAVLSVVSKTDYEGEQKIKAATGIEPQVLLRARRANTESQTLNLEWTS